MTANLPASITIHYGGAFYTITVSALTVAIMQHDGDMVTFEKVLCPLIYDGKAWFIDGIIHTIVECARHE